MQLNYSIIVPFYNSSKTIKRLLDSIPERPDLEIIIVDDCSLNDESEKLNRIIECNFSHRVKIIHSNENKGAGHARNVALAEASGNWLIFSDADDFFTPEFAKVLDKYVKEDCDAAYFSAISIKEIDGSPSTRHKTIEDKVTRALSGSQKDIDILRYTFYGPVCKLIRRRLITSHSISFQETFAFNDALFSVKVGYYAQNIKIENIPIYCITEASSSVSYSCNPQIIKGRLKAIAAVNRFAKAHSISKDDMPVLPQLIYSRHLGIIGMVKLWGWYLNKIVIRRAFS